MSPLLRISILVVLTSAYADNLLAGVIATSLPPDNSYCLGCGNAGIGGPSDQSFAVRFSVATTANLGGIDVGVSRISGGNTLLLYLLSDIGGSPGSALESFIATGQMQDIGPATSIVSVSSILQPALTAGNSYWLAASVPLNDFASWYSSSLNISGTQAFRFGAGAWSVGPTNDVVAFRISSVPEPASTTLVVAGSALLILRRRTRVSTMRTRILPPRDADKPHR